MFTKIKEFVFGVRIKGEPINLDLNHKPKLWVTYPQVERMDENEWYRYVNASRLYTKYSSGSL